jgi:hypothetical protein
VEEDSDFDLSAEMKAILDERIQENGKNYLTAEESINQLNKRYGFPLMRQKIGKTLGCR